MSTICLFGLVLVGAYNDVTAAPQTSGTDEARSAWTGVYTDGQAERGAVVYARSCSKCHGPDRLGNSAEEIPPLVGDEFMDQWTGEPLVRLMDRISTGMPSDKPGSLRSREYTDLVAYLLRANGFPSGDGELRQDKDVLRRIVITRVR